MKKLLLVATMLFTPLVVNATYNHKSYYNNSHSGQGHNSQNNNNSSNGSYGNPLVGHKMPKNCKWVWVNGKKETKCGNNHKMSLAKFCKKYPNSRKCKKSKPPTSVSEPTPLALLTLGLLVAFFARRK